MNYLPLLNNLALLVSLSVLDALLTRRFRPRTLSHAGVSGLAFGLTAVLGMMAPMHWTGGIIFDGRSIVLGLAGLFGGPGAGAVAALMAAGYRLWLGGAGLGMGLAVILASALLGVAGHRWRQRHPLRPLSLLGLGGLIHGTMLTLMALLPGGYSGRILLHIGLPVMLLFPGVFMVVGLFLLEQEDRLRSERAVRDSEERYRAIVESTSDYVMRYDRHGVHLFGNPATLAFLGLTTGQFVGRTHRQLGFPDSLCKVWETAIDQVFRSASTTTLEFALEAPPGPAVLELRLSPELDGQGRVLSVVGVCRDVSERHQQAAEIQRLTRLYAALGQVNQSIVWADSRDGLVAEVCAALMDTGAFRWVWIGRHDPDAARIERIGAAGDPGPVLAGRVVRTDAAAKPHEPAARAILEGEPWLENHGLTGAERAPWQLEAAAAGMAAAAGFPIRVGGEVWGVLALFAEAEGSFSDKESALLEAMALDVSFALEQLEREVQRKRAEQQHRELAEHLQKAQRLESLGTLAGGVAHDINNVLAAILGLASAHRETLVPEAPLARSLDTITKACERGRDVVRNLLAFGHKSVATSAPVDLNGLVRETCRLLDSTTLKRIQIQAQLQEPLPALEGDAGALSHALMNLCVNAIDAMAGSGSLWISSHWDAQAGTTLSVRDTGPGMTPEVLKNAVEPFFTTKPVGKGTGLGLAMVYGTMKAHGGSLELESAPGAGTTARLRFPAGPAEPLAQTSPGAGVPVEPIAPSLTILLVDDDDLIRASLAPMLGLLGHEVVSAEGGQEALDRLGAGLDVDLVILDMNMPGMNGAETLAELKLLRPAQRVLLCTGFSDHDLQALGDRYPGLDSIAKPFNLQEIRDKIGAMEIVRPVLA